MTFKRIYWLSFCLVLVTTGCNGGDEQTVVQDDQKEVRPNVLIIVADDLGFSDLGAFGSEIETPNLDELAHAGVRMTNFHVAPTCSPTRAMLLTGVDSHLAGLGNMIEEIAPNQIDQTGYEGYLNENVVSLPALLRDAGYRTYLSGKWHLGLQEENSPAAQGFERSFAMLQGGASHFSDMAPIYAEDPNNVPIAKYRKDGKTVTQLPDNFEFSSQFYVDELISYLEQDKASGSPFFAYLSFTVPHFPLQAPAGVIDKYAGKYAAGYEALQRERLAAQKRLGLIPDSTPLAKLEIDATPWEQLSESEQQISARSMEIYAAMVDDMDQQVGRLFHYLRKEKLFDNTFVLFMSDNGSEGHDLEGLWNPEEFPAAYDWITGTHDFSLEAMGGKNTYVMHGPGWGGAASPAMQGYKAFPTEGGTRSASFIHYPKEFQGGKISHHLVHVKDVAPSILELADVDRPGDVYNGRQVFPITGFSALPVWRGDVTVAASKDRVIGTELFAKKAVRHGDWKIVHMPPPHGSGDWQLYNLEFDMAESNDLAESEPETLQRMIDLWDKYAEENNVILPDWVSGY